jgi:hypothetical protein
VREGLTEVGVFMEGIARKGILSLEKNTLDTMFGKFHIVEVLLI